MDLFRERDWQIFRVLLLYDDLVFAEDLVLELVKGVEGFTLIEISGSGGEQPGFPCRNRAG